MKPRVELHRGRWRVAHQPGATYACNDLKRAKEWCTVANFRKRARATAGDHYPNQLDTYRQVLLAAGYRIHEQLEREALSARRNCYREGPLMQASREALLARRNCYHDCYRDYKVCHCASATMGLANRGLENNLLGGRP